MEKIHLPLGVSQRGQVWPILARAEELVIVGDDQRSLLGVEAKWGMS